MKTGILLRAIQQRTQLNILKQQNQQSTTQTKPSVVVQPRQMKDLSRKILNERLVKVLIKKRLAISSLVKIVILSSKPNLGKQQRTGKVLGLEQIKVIAIRSHGLPSFFFSPFTLMFYIRTCSILSVSRVGYSKITVQKPVYECFSSFPFPSGLQLRHLSRA